MLNLCAVSGTFSLSAAGVVSYDFDAIYGTGFIELVGTGLNFTVQVKRRGNGAWVNSSCMDATNGTPYDAGDTISSAAGKLLMLDARGVTGIQITYSSGAGTTLYIGAAPYPFTGLASGGYQTIFGARAATLAFVPTITATPDYSALDVVGGIQTITGASLVTARPIKVKSLVLKDKGGQGPALTFMFFKATPTGGTYTDNGALVLGSGDLANLVGTIQVVAGDWYTPVSGSKVASLSGFDMVIDVDSVDLFALIIHDGAAWNAASTSDLQVELGIERL